MIEATQTAKPLAVGSTNPLEPGVCHCRSFCRSDINGVMINGRRYPAPDHADGCPAQVREQFVRVEYHGHSCVIEPRDVDAMREDLCADDYIFTDVMLTRDQFDLIEDFAGF